MSMTEIMAWHRDIAWNHQTGESVCGDCDKVLGPMGADMSEQDGWLRAHVADELTEAGYGLERDAGARALKEAADDLTRLSYIKPGDPGRDEYEQTLAVRRGNTDNWLRARAEALTKGTA